MQKHRKPPLPVHYHVRITGQCRYCGQEILAKNGKRSTRALWHPACFDEYKVLFWPQETRKAVWKRDKGICAECKKPAPKSAWDMDHITPLIEGKGSSDLSFWKLDNCQLLCQPCHKIKTAREAGERAAARRANKKP